MTTRANYLAQDANYVTTKALPNGAASVETSGLDLGALTTRGARLEEDEILIEAPILTTAELPDAQTMKYDVQTDDDVDWGSAKTIAKEVLVQTGAGGEGAAAASARFRIPTDAERYIRIQATNSGAGNCSSKSMTFSIRF